MNSEGPLARTKIEGYKTITANDSLKRIFIRAKDYLSEGLVERIAKIEIVWRVYIKICGAAPLHWKDKITTHRVTFKRTLK